MSKLPMMVIVSAILVASFVVLIIPSANALTPRNFQYFDDRQLTARLGNHDVCGDHICAPGEWDKLVSELSGAQRGQQANVNATAPTSAATVPKPGTSNAVCNSIENLLSSAGVSESVVTKVMTDLGCAYK